MSFQRYLENHMDEMELSGARPGIEIVAGQKHFKYRAGEKFQAASLIKIPILIEAYRQSESGKFSLEDKAVINKDATSGGTGILKALSDGLVVTIKDLMTLMITVSDNTAANILIDMIGINELNKSFWEIGLENTVLQRKMMDFASIEKGKDNFTTAIDIARCLKRVNEENYLSKANRVDFLRILQMQQFKSKLPALMDESKMYIGNKTGELPFVEHDCAILHYGEVSAYIAVLTDGFREPVEAKNTISRIGKHVYDYLLENY